MRIFHYSSDGVSVDEVPPRRRPELTNALLRKIYKELVRGGDEPSPSWLPIIRPDDEFTWVTHKGQMYEVSEMATPHLFYSLRMLFNHVVPPVFRVLGAGETMKRYDDVKYWSPDYQHDALEALSHELESRDDLDDALRYQFEDIKQNAAALVALGL